MPIALRNDPPTTDDTGGFPPRPNRTDQLPRRAAARPRPASGWAGLIDTVLASRAVVAAIRLAIIFAAAFVVVSVVALIARGQWLIRVGPVQVSEQVSDIDAENQRLTKSLDSTREIVDDLRQDLAEANRMVGEALRNRGEPR